MSEALSPVRFMLDGHSWPTLAYAEIVLDPRSCRLIMGATGAIEPILRVGEYIITWTKLLWVLDHMDRAMVPERPAAQITRLKDENRALRDRLGRIYRVVHDESTARPQVADPYGFDARRRGEPVTSDPDLTPYQPATAAPTARAR